MEKTLAMGILVVDCFLICLMELMERKDNGRLLVLCPLGPVDVVMENLGCTQELISILSGLDKLWVECKYLHLLI